MNSFDDRVVTLTLRNQVKDLITNALALKLKNGFGTEGVSHCFFTSNELALSSSDLVGHVSFVQAPRTIKLVCGERSVTLQFTKGDPVVFYPGDIPIKVCDTITRFDDLMSNRDLGTDRIDDLHGYTIRERRWNFFPIFKFMVHHRMITREDLDHLKRDENEGTFQGGGEIGEYLALLDGYVPPDDVE